MSDLFEFFEIFEDGLFRNLQENKNEKMSRSLLKINPMDLYNDDQFRVRFRMSKNTASDMLKLIENKIFWFNKSGDPTPPMIQLFVTLRILATGTFQQVDGDLFNLS